MGSEMCIRDRIVNIYISFGKSSNFDKIVQTLSEFLRAKKEV